jgi:hypothetical protein
MMRRSHWAAAAFAVTAVTSQVACLAHQTERPAPATPLWSSASAGDPKLQPAHDEHFHNEHCGHYRRWYNDRWVYFYGDRWEYYDNHTGSWYYFG